MPTYREYAAIYDRSGQLSFSLRIVPYLHSLLDRHLVQGSMMLELACGTGTVAISMAEEGWTVLGVDGSAEMLAQARAKQGDRDLPISWSQQDMREVTVPTRVSLATCLYDSINYMLTSEDLVAVFHRVYAALEPGGLFLFDMNTAWAFATLWDDETYFTDGDTLSVIMHSDYDARRQRALVKLVAFEQQGELYRRIEERHIEQAYPPEQVATLLTDAGLQVEASYECFTLTPPKPTTYRIMWAARRPAHTSPSH